MVSGANFVLSILLGRWLEPVQYGAFSLAYSLFLLLGTFHTAVFAEPLLVFGPGKYAARFKKYLGVLTVGHLAVMVPVGLLVLGASLLLGRFYSPEVQRALSALALAGPFILLLWVLRRAFYVIVKPEWALLGGVAYFAILLGSTLALRAAGRISPATAFLAMGASALPVSVLLAGRLGPQWGAGGEPSAAAVAGEHWRYARWAVGAAALSWVPGNVYFTLLPAWVGLEGTAALRALANLVMPATHAISALSLLLMPMLARRRHEGQARMRRIMAVFLALFLAGAGVYNLILVIFRRQIVELLYGGRYADAVPLVPLVGLLAFLAALISVFGAALRALERPDKVFWSYLASSVVAVGGGVLLARSFGVAGALGGLLLSSSTTAVMMLLLYRGRRAELS
jgi:O-antigen/teichoic acid export membrane protein